MSFYNLIYGFNPCVLFILPMLDKHPDEYPRFRDCYLKDSDHPEYDNYIHVYIRVGGNNRNSGLNEEELYKHPNYITTFDDSFDSTYASYIFSVPDKWKDDFNKIINGKTTELSNEYKEKIYEVFPKLKEALENIFNKTFQKNNNEV